MNTQVPQLHGDSNDSDTRISLLDVLCFLKGSYKTIAITGVVGVVFSLIYLAITPKQYEATAQIVLAQIGIPNTKYPSTNLSPLGINIEEPALVISRLSLPSSFLGGANSECGFDDRPDSINTMIKTLKFGVIKGVTNVIEIRALGASPEAAKVCANAIFELIKTTQTKILSPYIEEAKILLAYDEVSLQKAKALLSNADKVGSQISGVYLATRDEIHYLLDEIAYLKSVVASSPNRLTHLIAPIYASDTPISPKKWMAFLVGVFGGLLLGFVVALARVKIQSLRTELGALEGIGGGGDRCSRTRINGFSSYE